MLYTRFKWKHTELSILILHYTVLVFPPHTPFNWLTFAVLAGSSKEIISHHGIILLLSSLWSKLAETQRPKKDQMSSVQLLSRVRLFETPWIAALQASLSITISRSSLRLTSIESVMPSSHLILLSPSPSAPNPSQHQSLFQWVNSSHQVAKVLEFQLQHHSLQRNPRTDLLQNGLVGSPCSPTDSQESSPTPQFKRINSSVLSFLHSPTLTSIHDH